MAANGISTLANKQLRQEAKLALAALKRVTVGNIRTVYDINTLPTKYSNNNLIDNANTGGLQQGRPWVTFQPSMLFINGEYGVWYDAGDLSTLFQDTAGTIPVTTPGQTVALMKDKSGRGINATQSVLTNRPTYMVDPYGYGYLNFNGTSNFMVSGVINLSTTNKVTASVGLFVDPSKVTAGAAICLGSNANSVNGTFLIGAPSSTADHSFYLRGSSTLQARMPNAVVGDDVLTGLFDLGQSTKELQLIPRLSGVVAPSIAWTGTTAGGGNFSNQPLYIGSMGGASTFFQGHIYSIIVRGAQSSTLEVLQTEVYINSKLD